MRSADEYRYHKQWRYDRAHGRTRMTDAEPARLHIATCLGAGMSIRAIAAAAGLSASALSRIWRGQDQMRHSTARAILAVEPGVTTAASNGTTEPFVPRIGAMRRVQALIALGWPHHELKRHSGVQTTMILSQRGQWITASTHAAIVHMYDDLSMTPGPSEKSRAWGKKLGYLPPLAWDDDDLDDLYAGPATDDERESVA